MTRETISAGFARSYKGWRIHISLTRGLNSWEDKHAYLTLINSEGWPTYRHDYGLFGYTVREANQRARAKAHEIIDAHIARYGK